MDAQLQTRSVVRCQRTIQSATGCTRTDWQTPHECESACQWRRTVARATSAGVPVVWRCCTHTRCGRFRSDACHGEIPARRHEDESADEELPAVQPRREQL